MSIKVLVATALSLMLTIPTVSYASDDEDELRDIAGVFTARELALKVKTGGVKIIERTESYVTKEIILDNKRVQEVHLYKRDPAVSDLPQWPTVFILSGLGQAKATLDLLPHVPNVSIVVMEYPVDMSQTANAWVQFAKNLPKTVFQIVGTYLWLEQQIDVDKSKIVSINISLGTFVAPAAFRLLSDISVPGDENNQHYPALTIFAFGGGDLEPFVDANITDVDLNRMLSDGAKAIKRMKNFKRLHGPFLVINGTQDEIIPQASADYLFNELPDSKERIYIDTQHIAANRPEVAQQLFQAMDTWLRAKSFIQ